MQVERATLSDVDSLSVLFDDYRVFYEKNSDINGARAFLTDRISKTESVIFISRVAHHGISGFVQLYPIFSSTRMQRLWLLNDLFVIPMYRGTGTSVSLIETAKAFSRETSSCGLILETAKSNRVANKLYQRMGFIMDSQHNYYEWNN
jgi:GNAT superfamily N-acetyltransferase